MSDSEASSTRKPATRSAELPDEFGEPHPAPDTTENDDSPGRKDRGAVPPDGRTEEASKSKLKRCEKTMHEHIRKEIKFSRAAREIVTDRLFTEEGFENLGAYTKATFDVEQNTFRKWTYYANVFDVIKENREEIAERSLTNVRDVPLPRIKGWTRPLHKKANKGLVEEVIETWAAVVRRHGSSITEKRVRQVREEVLGDNKNSGEDSENDEGDSEDEDPESPEGTENPEDNDSPDPSGEESGEDPSDDETSGPESPGFGIDHPEEIGRPEDVTAPQPDGSPADQCPITKQAVEELAETVEQKESGLPNSSAEHMVASKVWKVLVPSPIGVGGGLPEDTSAKEDPIGATLKPDRLEQLTGLAPGADGERVLVCPGVDLFGEVVPEGVTRAVLARCRKTDHKPVVFTRHLGRASRFDFSDIWIGTPAERASLETAEQRLKDAAPDAAVRWLLYDVEKEDRENAPSFSDSTDWVVFDPGDRNSGIALTLREAGVLTSAATDINAGWAFRNPFKTCGASSPMISSSS